VRAPRTSAAVGALALTMLGCVSPDWPLGTWVKPGASRAQQLRDEYACERYATVARGPDDSPAALYAECMRSKGYRRAPAAP
jgi:hypothetical protein